MAAGSSDARILCYATPSLALLLNPQFEHCETPRIWEAFVDVEAVRGDAIIACSEVATTRQITPPVLTGLHHARFAVLCALAAYGENARFRDWAHGWLAGTDDHAARAGALADQLEAETGRPEITMAARAARAAALAGERGDEVDTQVINCAAEAIGIALRITRLDLSSLALQAVPSS